MKVHAWTRTAWLELLSCGVSAGDSFLLAVWCLPSVYLAGSRMFPGLAMDGAKSCPRWAWGEFLSTLLVPWREGPVAGRTGDVKKLLLDTAWALWLQSMARSTSTLWGGHGQLVPSFCIRLRAAGPKKVWFDLGFICSWKDAQIWESGLDLKPASIVCHDTSPSTLYLAMVNWPENWRDALGEGLHGEGIVKDEGLP